MSVSTHALLVYLASRAVPAFATLILTVLCIAFLSPEQYGAYSVALTAAGVASSFVAGACGQPLLRYSRELRLASLWHALWTLPLAVGLCAMAAVLVYLAATTGMSMAGLLAAAAVPIVGLLDTRRNLFVAGGHAGAVLILDSWRSVLALSVGGLLLYAGSEQATAPLAAQLVAAGLSLVLVRERATDGPRGSRQIDRIYALYGLGFAGWMAGVVALSVAERALLADIGGLGAIGRYAAQADVINPIFAAGAGALASTMMPAYLAQTVQRDAAALRKMRRQGVLGCLAIALLCLLLGSLLALIPDTRVARALTADVSTAMILVAAATVWAAAGFIQKPIELSGQTYLLSAGLAGALVLFLVVAPPLAERLAASGVALAKLLAGCAFALFVGFVGREPH